MLARISKALVAIVTLTAAGGSAHAIPSIWTKVVDKKELCVLAFDVEVKAMKKACFCCGQLDELGLPDLGTFKFGKLTPRREDLLAINLAYVELSQAQRLADAGWREGLPGDLGALLPRDLVIRTDPTNVLKLTPDYVTVPRPQVYPKVESHWESTMKRMGPRTNTLLARFGKTGRI